MYDAQVSSERETSHGVMEGSGAYNLHARIPAGAAALALPSLEQAATNLAIDGGEQPVVIADYGSSQGKNSLAPMRAAIKVLRARVGRARPICVVHIDQAANDFNTLFDVLHSDPERYSDDDPNVFPSAIGRSFYEAVLPKEHVHLAWSSYAAVWLSRTPMPIGDHFISVASAASEVCEAFRRQAADDWKWFLSLRAGELRTGGRLVIVLPGVNDDGSSGFQPLFRSANSALAEVVAEGTITDDERARMVVGTYPRRRSELLEPFSADGQFSGLTVDRCEVCELPDPAWIEYERGQNRELLANRQTAFFRSVFVPSLASTLTGLEKRQIFANAIEGKLKRRLMDQPTPFHSFVQVIVLTKHT